MPSPHGGRGEKHYSCSRVCRGRGRKQNIHGTESIVARTDGPADTLASRKIETKSRCTKPCEESLRTVTRGAIEGPTRRFRCTVGCLFSSAPVYSKLVAGGIIGMRERPQIHGPRVPLPAHHTFEIPASAPAPGL